ncbi:MAG TPA: His/Gly/Thr/Pro-type tRNA ligase C-terminal domain-containing protein, partial [Solirubrobacteraceae bacterium]
PVAPSLTDLYVGMHAPAGGRAAFALVREARRAGLQARLELAGRSLKGQLRHADRIGARYVALVGDGPSAPVSLRDMASREELETAFQNVIPTILRGSRL